MDVMVFNVHSFVDVITNSSTELFVCDTEKSAEAVGELLREVLAGYNVSMGTDFQFDAVFCEPEVATAESVRQLGADWGDYYRMPHLKEGAILIYGAADNSIPYEMWGMIESRLGWAVDRVHLG